MIAKELLQQIKLIQIKFQRLATDALAGEYSSVFRGTGMEFEEVREYQMGDDVRLIDWNVTARMDHPYVKVFREEREMTMMLMVDVSSSQYFGGAGKFKVEQSAEMAAILAFLATKNGDKVGLIMFSDHIEEYIPPKKGKSHVWKIVRSVLSHKRGQTKTDIAGAIDFMLKVRKRKCQTFLISDFQDESYERNLSLLSYRHNLVCIKLRSTVEDEFLNAGVIELIDPESQETVIVDTSSKGFKDKMKEIKENDEGTFRQLMKSGKVGWFSLSEADSPVTSLVAYMKEMEGRLNR